MTQTQSISDVVTTSAPVDLDGFASYEDGDATVICDRKNATAAWVRSTHTVAVSR